jgi:hypothetical protein
MESSAIPEVARGLFSSAQAIAFDSIIGITLAVLFLIYTITFSKGKLLSLLFSFYATAALFVFFPFFSVIPDGWTVSRPLIELIFYILLLGITAFATRNCIRAEFRSGATRRVLMAALFSISGAVFALTITWQVLPNISQVHQFGPPITYFTDPSNPAVWWILIIPVVLAFSVKSKRAEG